MTYTSAQMMNQSKKKHQNKKLKYHKIIA